MRYDRTGTTYRNTAVSAEEAIIDGRGVTVVNTEEGRFTGGVRFASTDGALINDRGGIVRNGTGGADSIAVTGSSGADTINNAGLINGRVMLGGGADSFISRDGTASRVDLGDGDDLARIEGSASSTPWIDGGAGRDRLEITNTSNMLSGAGITGFESLAISTGGNFIAFTGFRGIALLGTDSGAFDYIPSAGLIDSANPEATVTVSGLGLRLVNSVVASVTGSASREVVEVAGGGRIGGSVDLGDGQDMFVFSDFEGARGSVGRSITGGAGVDTLSLQWFRAGDRFFDLAQVSGFEILQVNSNQGVGRTTTRISNANGLQMIEVGFQGSLALSRTDAPDAGVSVLAGMLTLDANTTIRRFGMPERPGFDQGVDHVQADDTYSTHIVNAGLIHGDVRFHVGDDLYDGRAGSVGGTVSGDAGNDTLMGGIAAERLEGNNGADLLQGGGGDDVLVGGMGTDRLDGGAGRDTAVFGISLAQAVIARTGTNGLTVTSTEGTDTLVDVDVLRFADGAFALASTDPLFDPVFYATRNADVFRSGMDLLGHYRGHGAGEARDPNAFFSASGYLADNADVARAGVDALDHYRSFGWREGRDPSAGFDTRLYLLHNPDVAAAGMNPLEHFLTYGRPEGRQAYVAIGDHIMDNGFDPDFYRLANPDVVAARIDPWQHYIQYGAREGRDPNAWFDDEAYLRVNPDVAAAGMNPLQHYHDYGWHEGRDPSAGFDTRAYLAANLDVAAAGVDPLTHYLRFGAFEGRTLQADALMA